MTTPSHQRPGTTTVFGPSIFERLDPNKVNQSECRPLVLNLELSTDRETLQRLIDQRQVIQTHDTLTDQLESLVQLRNPQRTFCPEELAQAVKQVVAGAEFKLYGRWIFYPWSGQLVHLPPPAEFREIRLNRNQNKIRAEEQARLACATVAVVGLSVGNVVARTLALEGACGCLKLADFDGLDLSNLNRIQAGVADLGLNKAVIAARQIAELDPYLPVTVLAEGVQDENLDAFLTAERPVTILVDECDNLRMKLRLRERARELRIPVLMETSDRGMLDIERFDLEPDRPIFHGLLQPLGAKDLESLSAAARMDCVQRMIGKQTMSNRLAESLADIGRTLSTWPQLGSDVTLGGATVTAAVRAIILGNPLPSGRCYVDLQRVIASDRAPLDRGEASVAAARPPTNGEVTLRGATAADAEQIAELFRLTYRESSHPAKDSAYLAATFQSGHDFWYVAVAEDKIVGCTCSVRHSWNRVFESCRSVTLPEFRGSGLGWRLYQLCLAESCQRVDCALTIGYPRTSIMHALVSKNENLPFVIVGHDGAMNVANGRREYHLVGLTSNGREPIRRISPPRGSWGTSEFVRDEILRPLGVEERSGTYPSRSIVGAGAGRCHAVGETRLRYTFDPQMPNHALEITAAEGRDTNATTLGRAIQDLLHLHPKAENVSLYVLADKEILIAELLELGFGITAYLPAWYEEGECRYDALWLARSTYSEQPLMHGTEPIVRKFDAAFEEAKREIAESRATERGSRILDRSPQPQT